MMRKKAGTCKTIQHVNTVSPP